MVKGFPKLGFNSGIPETGKFSGNWLFPGFGNSRLFSFGSGKCDNPQIYRMQVQKLVKSCTETNHKYRT